MYIGVYMKISWSNEHVVMGQNLPNKFTYSSQLLFQRRQRYVNLFGKSDIQLYMTMSGNEMNESPGLNLTSNYTQDPYKLLGDE